MWLTGDISPVIDVSCFTSQRNRLCWDVAFIRSTLNPYHALTSHEGTDSYSTVNRLA